MSQLFHQLLYQKKTQRWFHLLDLFERIPQQVSELLSITIGCTQRTIQSDIKKMNHFFEGTCRFIGDQKGYHFFLEDPAGYVQKKQMILIEEKLFDYVDTLADQPSLTSKQWCQKLNVDINGFYRRRKQLSAVLAEYNLSLDSKNGQISGPEVQIRAFYTHFYFDLPMLPERLIKQRKLTILKKVKGIKSSPWLLDHLQLTRCLWVTRLRNSAGYFLVVHPKECKRQKALAAAFDNCIITNLPIPEKAFIFLSTLSETSFLSTDQQAAFLMAFFSEKKILFSGISNEETILHEWLQAMTHCIQEFSVWSLGDQLQLPSTIKLQVGALKKEMQRQKEAVQRIVSLSFDLTGPIYLRKWIQSQVQEWLRQRGYKIHLIEGNLSLKGIMPIVITNANQFDESRNYVIKFSTFPSKQEIQMCLAAVYEE